MRLGTMVRSVVDEEELDWDKEVAAEQQAKEEVEMQKEVKADL